MNYDVSGIYKITNKVNGHSYIGQSVNIAVRFYKHINESNNPNRPGYNYPLYKALRKYGLMNFDFEILEECDISQLSDKEVYWIQYYDTFFNGYNQTMGGNQSIQVMKESIIGIIDLLKNTNKSIKDIAIMYKVSVDTVYDINSGLSWHHNTDYPIRPLIKGVNRRIKETCPLCNGHKSYKSVLCKQCRNIERKQCSKRPSKQVLSQLIINYNFVQIGNMFNVTDKTIRKWCKDYDLPYMHNDVKFYKKLLCCKCD